MWHRRKFSIEKAFMKNALLAGEHEDRNWENWDNKNTTANKNAPKNVHRKKINQHRTSITPHISEFKFLFVYYYRGNEGLEQKILSREHPPKSSLVFKNYEHYCLYMWKLD